jgi:predicted nucleotidyltransferase
MSELNRIKGVIESMRPELTKRYYINRIGLFGPVVSEDFLIEEDDVDIIVDFKKPIGDRIMDLTELLETKLNAKVCLITKGSIDKAYLKEIKSGIQYV